MVYRTALAITGDTDAAADLLQDVFLRLFRFAERIEPHRPVEPWIYRITVNQAYTWVKRRRWMKPLEEVSEWLSREDDKSPSEATESGEEWQLVENAIQCLPLRQRMVVVLYYINECSLEEISEILDVPKGTIKSRLHYGRQALKKLMDLQGGTVTEVRYEFT
jgi:RNA polymerase sigma-70 factor (ECF subfamily)